MAEEMETTTGETKGKRQKRCLTSKQTKFARGVAAGASPTEAFAAAYGRHNASDASKQMRLPYVAEEIERMRSVNRAAFDLERQDMILYLTTILFTPVGQVDAGHLLAESYEAYRDGAKERVKVRMVSKIEAVKALCRMMGWWEADKPAEERETIFYIKKMWEDGPPTLVEGQQAKANH